MLPFVDEKRLFKALKPYYNQLTDAERKRNIRGDDRLYVSTTNEGYSLLDGLYQQKVEKNAESAVTIQGMRGTVLLSDDCVDKNGGSLTSPVKGLPMLYGNVVVCVRFRDPAYATGFVFPARKLKGARDPPRVLKPQDLDPQANRQWRSQVGMAPATQRAYMGGAGHRMMSHYTPRNGPNQQRDYGNVPPPMNLERNRNYPRGGSGNYGKQKNGGGGDCWGSN